MAEENQDEGEEKKSSKKMIIIIAVLLLIIAGGGAAFFMMGGEDSAAQGEETEEVESTEEKEEEESEQGAKEILYYDLEKPLRVNFPKGSSASLIEVKLAFLIDNEDTEEALKKHEPMIVNNLLMAISATGADKLKQAEGKNELRALMLDETGKVMEKMTGKNRVKEVFFTAFVMQ